MAQNSDAPKKRRGPGRPFVKGRSGNAGGRPRATLDVREWLRLNRGPLTVEALEATRELLGPKTEAAVRARVANDWLNKVLPDAEHVQEQLSRFLEQLKGKVDPAVYEKVLQVAAEVADVQADAG